MATPLHNPEDSSAQFPPQPPTPVGPLRGTVSSSVNSTLQRPMQVLMSTRRNGMIDYTVAFILFLAPWVLSYSDHAVAPVSRTLGAMILFYSLCTKYELGLVRFFPMQVHLFLDLGMALLLVAAPIHFAIWGMPGLMMVVLGLFMGAAALMTRHGQKFTRAEIPVRDAADRPIGPEGPAGSSRL